MNEQFYELPDEKQLRIINAGLEVFAAHDYKHASTELIAAKAGISKGLLFYYFQNKKSFYLFLYDYAAKLTTQFVLDTHFSEIRDFFELLMYAAEKKTQLSEKNPAFFDFALRSFYSENEDISDTLNKKTAQAFTEMFAKYFAALDLQKFRPEIDPKEILSMLAWLADGYLNEKRRAGLPVSADTLMEHYRRWSDMLKNMSYKEEFLK